MLIDRRPAAQAEPSSSPPGDAEETWDQKEMPFTEHLRELRNRLMICIAAVGALAVLLFLPSQYVIRGLTQLYFHGITLHAFGPADVIMAEFKFSLFGAIVLGLPVIVYQVWMFIVPAFHPRTRRMVYAYTLPSLLLAAAGIAFCHFLVLPRVVRALMLITDNVATPTFGIGPTLNFILILLLAFALVFQTPLVMVALARIGLVNAQMLQFYRRYAIMACLLIGGIAAPDASPFTMMMIAVPMFVLYEVSIWIIIPLEKAWRRSAAAAAAGGYPA